MPEQINAHIKSLVTAKFDSSRIAVGLPLKAIHQSLTVISDEIAPRFALHIEPVNDHTVYTSTANQNFYRPQFAVNTALNGKTDVRFLRDANGKIRLEIVLTETVPLKNAEPFNISVTAAALRWNNRAGAERFDFPVPTLIPTDNPADATKPNYLIRIGAELTQTDVERLNNALSNATANAMLDVSFSYSYWVDQLVRSPPPPPDDTPFKIIDGKKFFISTPRFKFSDALIKIQPHAVADAPQTHPVTIASPRMFRREISSRLKFDSAVIERVVAERKIQPNFRIANFTRSISFSFDPNLGQNRHIYAAIRQNDGVGERWENTAFGFVRRSGIANTVYRMPDEIRLAFSDELKAPHVMPVLFRDSATDETRVRVVLQAAPFHEPKKLVELSDFLFAASGGAVAAPNIVSGGYKDAKLTLTGAFPEQIQALKGKEFAIELENSFELVLDLTVEFYRFLCELITRVGLTGEVVVTLESPPPADAPLGTAPETIVRRVPMRLSLGDLAALPIGVRVPTAETSPQTIELVNLSGSELRCGGCAPRLLQIDDNSVVPLEVYKAEASASFPATLAAAGTLGVNVKPRVGDVTEASELLWNAVQVVLFDLELTENPEAILNRIHELAPAGSLALDINIECPMFTLAALPPEYADKLFRIVVEIICPGFAAQQITLSRDNARATIKMQRTLQDFISADALNIAAFSYRTKNIYFVREGAWSEARPAEGTNLFVFPNPNEV